MARHNGTPGYFDRPKPRFFGHRGAAGVAPENTLPSFERALREGAEYLELDVHGTRDGVVVVIHDDTIDRTTDGEGAVRDFTFAELGSYDAGARFDSYRGKGVRVPSLAGLLEACPGVPLNIEVKQREPAIEDRVVELLRGAGALARVVLAAEDDLVMRRLRAAAPDGFFSFSTADATEFFRRVFANDWTGYVSPGHALQIPPYFGETALVTAETVAAAHRNGIEIHVWTINDTDEMARLLALGVDGLMSDFPARFERFRRSS